MQVTCVAVLVNVVLMAMQFVTGWISGSDALLADGAHTLVDALGDGVVAGAIYFDQAMRAGRPHKLTPVAIVLANLLIAATGAELLSAGMLPNAVQGAGARPAAALAAFAVSVASVAAKAGLFLYLRAAAARVKPHDGDSLASALNAGAWHACADSVSSVVAAIGATGVLLGLPALDRSATALIGALILMAGLQRNASALRSLFRRLARMGRTRRAHAHAGQPEPTSSQA
ncbi:cation efflux family protein [Paraburkholderia unamae]|uniref:cation transporter n=1 Tax=Paraburkholderia unamae TaxID=219649 RepID=UPI000DC4E8D8|nr:cation transporter [Paraburkholderia unamae]RAR52261.1 cation efflux family protein [Paraburkholderia unamae]